MGHPVPRAQYRLHSYAWRFFIDLLLWHLIFSQQRKKEVAKKKHWEIDYNELNLGNRVG
jgi:hypothetical protein